MRAGEMNRRVQIQQQTPARDEFGQPQQVWTDVVSCWARIRAVTGKQVYAASGFTSELSHAITIRKPAVTVRSSMRVLYRSRVWIVQAVSNPDEGTRELILMCLELNEGV